MTETPSTPHLPADTITLDSGARMPLLGFGTWQIEGQEAMAATAAALAAGYRHLDTATVYGNEAEVGKALRGSGVAREDVFVTTKCPPSLSGKEIDTLKESLALLGTSYVDLWLIHWPDDRGANPDMWRAFIEAKESGLTRDVGVSNYGVDMLDELATTTGVMPSVNQIEWSPLLFDATVQQEHRERGVALEGYSALRGGTLEDRTITTVADRHGRTSAQVIIRWHLQHGVIVIPKSRDADRIRSNADVGDFELTADDMTALDGLNDS